MKIYILPADLKTVRISKKNMTGIITIPQDLMRRYDLKEKEDIIIAYVCKADEDIKIIE